MRLRRRVCPLSELSEDTLNRDHISLGQRAREEPRRKGEDEELEWGTGEENCPTTGNAESEDTSRMEDEHLFAEEEARFAFSQGPLGVGNEPEDLGGRTRSLVGRVRNDSRNPKHD